MSVRKSGLLTGGIAALLLYYPAGVYLPASYTPGAPEASGILAGLCVLLAGMVWLSAGSLAGARFHSAKDAVLAGTLAGGLAGLVIYLGGGAAAVGLVILQPMFAALPGPMAFDQAFMALLVNATSQMLLWFSLAVAGLVLAGGILGALGGLLGRLVEGGPEKSFDLNENAWRSAAGALLNALFLGAFDVVILALLPNAIEQSAQNAGVVLPYTAVALANMTILVPLVVWCGALLAVVLLAFAPRPDDPAAQRSIGWLALWMLLVAWGMGIYMGRGIPFSNIYSQGLLAPTVLASLCLLPVVWKIGRLHGYFGPVSLARGNDLLSVLSNNALTGLLTLAPVLALGSMVASVLTAFIQVLSPAEASASADIIAPAISRLFWLMPALSLGALVFVGLMWWILLAMARPVQKFHNWAMQPAKQPASTG